MSLRRKIKNKIIKKKAKIAAKIQKPLGIFLMKTKKIEPMAIIMVDGGFCSTLVKYTLGKYIEKKLGMKVKYDLTWFETDGMDCDGKFQRNFDLLKVFPNIDFDIATKEEIDFYKKYFLVNNEFPYKFREDLFQKKQPMYVDGYYENWKYFDFVKDELLNNLDFSSLELNENNKNFLADIASKEESVAVHIRRGDFVNLGLCILTPEYYVDAIKHVTEKLAPKKPHFYFFSNGMDWVKDNVINNIPADISYTLVEGNDNNAGYVDLYLISQCNHQISSNSSFGFWGGLLNRNNGKTVIIPDKWVPITTGQTVDSEIAHCVPGWDIIPCEGFKND